MIYGKKYYTKRKICIITADHYIHRSAKMLLEMVEEAKKDFPGIREEEMEVTFYADKAINGGLLSIEFNVKGKNIPSSYERISDAFTVS